MSRVVHFELPADNIERAIQFYQAVFNWQFHKWDGPMDYWMIQTGDPAAPGIDGGLGPRRHPGETPVNTIRVPDVDSAVAAIQKAGGAITVPKSAIPTVGWLAYATDPEGNPFGVMQDDPNAA